MEPRPKACSISGKRLDTAANEQDAQNPSEGGGTRPASRPSRFGRSTSPTASSTPPATTPRATDRQAVLQGAGEGLMLLTVEANPPRGLGVGAEMGGFRGGDLFPHLFRDPSERGRGDADATARAGRRRRAGPGRAAPHEPSRHRRPRPARPRIPRTPTAGPSRALKMGLGPRRTTSTTRSWPARSPTSPCPTAWAWPPASTRTPRCPPPCCRRPASASWSAARSRPWPRPAIRARACSA